MELLHFHSAEVFSRANAAAASWPSLYSPTVEEDRCAQACVIQPIPERGCDGCTALAEGAKIGEVYFVSRC